MKVRIPGGAMAYAIPEHAKEGSAPDDHLRRVMGEFVVEVAYSANIVVLRTPHRGDEAMVKTLQEFVKQRLLPYKYPRVIEYMEALPKTGTGKIDRQALRALRKQ